MKRRKGITAGMTLEGAALYFIFVGIVMLPLFVPWIIDAITGSY